MKKSIFVCLLFVLCLLASFARAEESPYRALFVSVIEQPSVLSSRSEIDKLVDFAKQAKIKTLFVQIYRANKAWFQSKVSDSAPYRIYLEKVGEDPFALLIRKAHANGIQVHAWLNMLTLSENADAPLLKKYGPEILTKNLKPKKTLEDYKIDGQFFLEPGDLRVREELSIMVEEILHAYSDLDGIQFDYIRYPDKDPRYGFTKINIDRFKKTTGIKVIEEKSPAWKNWKRNQVTEFLKQLVKRTRAIRPNIHISTTGCVSYVRAYQEAFQDWPSWVNKGLAEFVTVMSYPDNTLEFKENIEDARKRVKDFKKIGIAIPVYKLVHSPKIFEEQFQACQESGAGACVFFYYGNFQESPALTEPLLQNSSSQGRMSH